MIDASPVKEIIRSRGEDGVWCTLQAGEDVCSKIIYGADEVFVAHQKVCESKPDHEGADPCTNKALDSFLRRDLDELSTTEGDSANISKDVVGDDQRNWQKKPDQAFKNIVHHEMSLYDDKEQCHVSPRKLGELELVVALLKRRHKENETCFTISARVLETETMQRLTEDVHGKADEAMMCCKGEQNLIYQEDMLEVIDNAFTIDEIHGNREEVPVERLCKRQVLLLGRDLSNGDDFFEGYY
jgi:hypothetical protein